MNQTTPNQRKHVMPSVNPAASGLINKPLRFMALSVSLVACLAGTGCAVNTVSAGTQLSDELVILPAPATAWRTVVGTWGNMAELRGDSVAVAAPVQISASARGNGVQREALSLQWKDTWSAMLRFESSTPLDLRPYLNGTLEFDLEVTELAKGGVRATLSCGEHCDRSVNLIEPARGWIGKGWQHVALAMSCFAREGADFSKVWLPFMLEGNGSGSASVANVRISRAAKPGLACPDYRTESTTPVQQKEFFSIDWWPMRHAQKLQEKDQLLTAGTPPELVFIGDSITQAWEDKGREVWQAHYAKYHALDLGFGGDRTENVLWRLQHGEVDGLSPKGAVLMIGTNNVGQGNPERTAAGVKRVLEEIQQRLPSTKVLLLAIFPRSEKPDDFMRRSNERVNAIIAGYADGRRVHFLNINAALLEADGTLSKDIMPDSLHPNEKGYAIWQREMQSSLQELLNAP